ncbi:ABC transporter ATP-binding protein [uncultured Campylobacter sp.]|uniref:ABC transporter ATP-binding protein n=1 Tax=uncultured Campylobacter sp. TaxID=218934 RepID=UPI0026030201|nr:ABC transporter ATP-binding protein [uncultured Campylobacter sp.]
MEYNELRDIMLDNNEDKKSKSVKRILVLVAVFVIIFLAVLIAMKFLNSSETNAQIAQPDSRMTLPPEPDNTRSIPQQVNVPTPEQVAQAQPQPQPEPTQPLVQEPQQNNFEQVPIVPENKGQDSFEDMVKSLKEKEDKKQQEAQAGDPATPPTEPATIQGALKQNDAPSPQPSEPKAESKQHVNVVKTKEQKQKEAKNEKVAKQPKATDAHKEKVAKQKQTRQTPASGGDEAHSGSYIQVFAVKHFNEKAPELGKLKAAGYAYKLYRTNVNGDEIIKVLVGPYSGAHLKSELAKIKQNAAPNAFIVNIK